MASRKPRSWESLAGRSKAGAIAAVFLIGLPLLFVIDLMNMGSSQDAIGRTGSAQSTCTPRPTDTPIPTSTPAASPTPWNGGTVSGDTTFTGALIHVPTPAADSGVANRKFVLDNAGGEWDGGSVTNDVTFNRVWMTSRLDTTGTDQSGAGSWIWKAYNYAGLFDETGGSNGILGFEGNGDFWCPWYNALSFVIWPGDTYPGLVGYQDAYGYAGSPTSRLLQGNFSSAVTVGDSTDFVNLVRNTDAEARIRITNDTAAALKALWIDNPAAGAGDIWGDCYGSLYVGDASNYTVFWSKNYNDTTATATYYVGDATGNSYARYQRLWTGQVYEGDMTTGDYVLTYAPGSATATAVFDNGVKTQEVGWDGVVVSEVKNKIWLGRPAGFAGDGSSGGFAISNTVNETATWQTDTYITHICPTGTARMFLDEIYLDSTLTEATDDYVTLARIWMNATTGIRAAIFDDGTDRMTAGGRQTYTWDMGDIEVTGPWYLYLGFANDVAGDVTLHQCWITYHTER